MTQDEMSYNTKSALAAALKIRLKTQPLNKISIRELSEDCDINRQTFYYHFKDIYDLLIWALEDELRAVVEKQNNVLLWQDALYLIFQYLNENRTIAMNAYQSIGHVRFRRMIYENVYEILHNTVEMGCQDINISKKDMDFFTVYCMISLTGVVENWLTGELPYTPDEIIVLTENLLQVQITGAKTVYGKKSDLDGTQTPAE